MAKKPITSEAACLKMASLCSRSEQCEADILKKLMNLGLSSGDRKEVMEYLKEERYVDNHRFAGSYARDKARFSSWGPLKIKAMLISKRIPSAIITEALRSVESQVWKDGINKLAAAKSKSLDLTGNDGREDRIKLYRYLLGRGYTSAQSIETVRNMRTLQEESQK